MKRIISSLICIITLMAFLAIPAQAQYDIRVTSLNGGTNNLAATSTNSSVGVLIEATRSANVVFQPIFKLDGAGTTAVTFVLDQSADNANWISGTHSITVTPAGTSTVSVSTNISVGAVGFLRLNQIRNPNASAITNLTFKYATKRGL